MRIVNMPHAVNKDSKEELLKPNEVRHKRNMRSGSTDSNHMGCCENIKGNVKIPNPYVNPVVEEFNIQTIADPYESGLTSGGGSYLSGQTAIVIATPLSGYTFVNWTENGVEVSGENEYSFAVTRSRTLVANFAVALTEVNYGLLYNWYAARMQGIFVRMGGNANILILLVINILRRQYSCRWSLKERLDYYIGFANTGATRCWI